MKCDACGAETNNLRLTGELLGPHIEQACRNCVGPGIGWFYMRRPGDWDDDRFNQQQDDIKGNDMSNSEEIACETCGGSGFSGQGSGYGDVCGECGGLRYFPIGEKRWLGITDTDRCAKARRSNQVTNV